MPRRVHMLLSNFDSDVRPTGTYMVYKKEPSRRKVLLFSRGLLRVGSGSKGVGLGLALLGDINLTLDDTVLSNELTELGGALAGGHTHEHGDVSGDLKVGGQHTHDLLAELGVGSSLLGILGRSLVLAGLECLVKLGDLVGGKSLLELGDGAIGDVGQEFSLSHDIPLSLTLGSEQPKICFVVYVRNLCTYFTHILLIL